MTVDASPVDVGAVLSHIMKDGSEKPIYFASRALSKAEKYYAQIEREGLAVIFGDPVLSQVRKWIVLGLPKKRSLDFQPYTTKKDA